MQHHPAPRIVAAWLVVMASSAVLLGALDHLPGLLVGAPRRARVFASVEEAERSLRARLWLPSYYPDELRWPPARVHAGPGAPATVVIHVAGRRNAGERLVVAQSIGGVAAPPATLLQPGETMETTEVAIGTRRAHLVRVLVGTESLHDLWWDQDGRRVTLRYTGPVDRLLRMARSLERQAGRQPGS